jgi:hypothetical protein
VTADAPSPDVETVLTDEERASLARSDWADREAVVLRIVERNVAAALRGAGLPEPSGIDVDRLNREHPLDGKESR